MSKNQETKKSLKKDNVKSTEAEGLPGFVSSWNQMYALVLGWLIFLIGFFYAFTQYFS